MLNIVVLVSGGGTNLQALLDAKADGRIENGRFVSVISSCAGAYALERAAKAGIPCCVIERSGMKQEQFEDELLTELEKAEADLIVLAGFMTILSSRVTDRYPEKIINVHPALIPSFCGKGLYGLKVHEAVLKRGVKITGATVHFVNEVPDGGRIIAQKTVFVLDEDTPQTLQKRVMEQAEWKILPQAVAYICETRKINLSED